MAPPEHRCEGWPHEQPLQECADRRRKEPKCDAVLQPATAGRRKKSMLVTPAAERPLHLHVLHQAAGHHT